MCCLYYTWIEGWNLVEEISFFYLKFLDWFIEEENLFIPCCTDVCWYSAYSATILYKFKFCCCAVYFDEKYELYLICLNFHIHVLT